MAKKVSHIFRKEALKRLNSPERLDTRMEVVGRHAWLPLVAVGVTLVLFLTWSIYGLIPIKTVGRGILVRPNKTLSVGSTGEGVVARVEIREGDEVRAGQVLATLDLSALRLQLAQERDRLARLTADHAAETALVTSRLQLERAALTLRRETIEEKLAQDQAFLTRIQSIELENLGRRRGALRSRLRMRAELVKALEQHYHHQTLGDDTIEEDVVKAREAWVKGTLDAAAIEDELEELRQKEVELIRGHRVLAEEIASLRAELAQLDLSARKLNQEEQARRSTNLAARQEVEAGIATLELALEQQATVVSPRAGRIMELRVAVGQVVKVADVLALIEVGDPSQPVSCLTFVPVHSGKRMFPAMESLVCPDTVERERYGGIVAEVGTVNRYPLTAEAAAKWLGSRELAEELLQGGKTAIMVSVELARDPAGAGGYRWSSSKGPTHPVSTWTTCEVEVVLEKRPPITLALPFLKSLVN